MRVKKYRIAALLMIVHGGFMELGGLLCAVPALIWGTDAFDVGRYFAFRLPYFQENLLMMLGMGAIYGALRLTGAIGLLRGRMWGIGAVGDQLRGHAGADDVPAARGDHGRSARRECAGFGADGLFRR